MQTSQSESKAGISVVVRGLTTIEEFRRCVELEKEVWNFDPADSVSHHIMAVAHEAGGQVFGAFDGERMIGFALSFPAIRGGHVHLHSHMAAVIPAYQGRGVGKILKLAQRDEALARGIGLIEWTFDPLQTRNANFNINKLGAVVRRYIPNFYGVSSSPLHANLPTDRIVASWELSSLRVKAHIAGTIANLKVSAVKISVPKNMNELRNGNSALAAEIQSRVRQEFQQRFHEGYQVTGFTTDETEGHYLLEKNHAD